MNHQSQWPGTLRSHHIGTWQGLVQTVRSHSEFFCYGQHSANSGFTSWLSDRTAQHSTAQHHIFLQLLGLVHRRVRLDSDSSALALCVWRVIPGTTLFVSASADWSCPVKMVTPSENQVEHFMRLRVAAIDNLCNRCEESYPELVQSFGAAGVAAIREAIGFTLDFLRPAFEFGYLKPFIDYLYWLTETLKFSGVPADHVLTMLDWLSEFFEAQMQYEESGSIILALMSAKSKLITQNAASSGIDKHMPSAWPEYIEFEQALLKGDMTRAKVTFDNYIAAGKTLLEIELHLVQPALYQVGLDWQQNKVTVAQEHLATSTAITLIALEFSKVTLGTSNGKRVICACVEGNEHAVGIRIVADAFELNGWDVLFLGKDVSSKKLIEHTRKFGPHLICLSITLPNQLLAARAAIRDLHQAFHEKVPAIMLGGLAANTHTPMVEVVGADRTAPDASKAIEISTQFFGM